MWYLFRIISFRFCAGGVFLSSYPSRHPISFWVMEWFVSVGSMVER